MIELYMQYWIKRHRFNKKKVIISDKQFFRLVTNDRLNTALPHQIHVVFLGNNSLPKNNELVLPK